MDRFAHMTRALRVAWVWLLAMLLVPMGPSAVQAAALELACEAACDCCDEAEHELDGEADRDEAAEHGEQGEDPCDDDCEDCGACCRAPLSIMALEPPVRLGPTTTIARALRRPPAWDAPRFETVSGVFRPPRRLG